MTVSMAFLALHFLVPCSVCPATASRVLLGISPGWKFAGKSTGMRIFRPTTESSMPAHFSSKRCRVEISTTFPFGQGISSRTVRLRAKRSLSSLVSRPGARERLVLRNPSEALKHRATSRSISVLSRQDSALNSGDLLDPRAPQTHRKKQEATPVRRRTGR